MSHRIHVTPLFAALVFVVVAIIAFLLLSDGDESSGMAYLTHGSLVGILLSVR